jgi:mono/diheme cytochrome c family protein
LKRWLRRLGIGVIALFVVIVGAGATVYGVNGKRLQRAYDIKVEHVDVPTDAGAVERGKRFANVIAKCTDCHGANFQGQVMFDDKVFATLAAANLTRGKGGQGANYKTDEDWVRSIRHGIAPNGRPLVFMPSGEYYYVGDQDLGDLIAYLKSLPPQDNVLPKPKLGPIASMLFITNKMPLLSAATIDHTAKRPPDVTPAADATYGKYLARVGGCQGCHMENLAGSADAHGPPGSPPPANLTPAGNLGKWTEQNFVRALRTGRRPDGSEINSFMPWRYTAQMTDDEIHAVWLYLKTVPPVATPAKK